MGLGRGFPRSASSDLYVNDLGFAAMKAGFVIERHTSQEVRIGSRVDGALARTFWRFVALVGCGHVSGL
jgi:hypothetical protein